VPNEHDRGPLWTGDAPASLRCFKRGDLNCVTRVQTHQ
jgi:hypothetical protein